MQYPKTFPSTATELKLFILSNKDELAQLFLRDFGSVSIGDYLRELQVREPIKLIAAIRQTIGNDIREDGRKFNPNAFHTEVAAHSVLATAIIDYGLFKLRRHFAD